MTSQILEGSASSIVRSEEVVDYFLISVKFAIQRYATRLATTKNEEKVLRGGFGHSSFSARNLKNREVEVKYSVRYCPQPLTLNPAKVWHHNRYSVVVDRILCDKNSASDLMKCITPKWTTELKPRNEKVEVRSFASFCPELLAVKVTSTKNAISKREMVGAKPCDEN